MKIGIVGYGKMGKIIEGIALERGHEIVGKYHSNHPLNEENWQECDVAIEFTNPHVAVDNMRFLIKKGIPMIVGSTGWYEQFEEIKQQISDQNGAMLSSTNFSLGVNLFWKLAQQMASLMQTQKDYTAHILENHHTEKKDAPSGTAITLAEKVIAAQNTYSHWELTKIIHSEEKNMDEKNMFELQTSPYEEVDNALKITAIREPNVPGTHQLIYESQFDKIQLEHEAKNRNGFATGAVIAAEWIKDRKGVFQMSDLLKFEN